MSRPSGSLRRLFVAAIALALMALATSFTNATTANASQTYCHTFTQEYGMSVGAISTKVGYTYFHVTVCTNGHGITSYAAKTSNGTTGPGTTAGWKLTFDQPIQKNFASGAIGRAGYAQYRADGVLKDCASVRGVGVCSYAANFHEYLNVYMWKYPAEIPYKNPPSSYRVRIGPAHLHRAFHRTHGAFSDTPSGKIHFHG